MKTFHVFLLLLSSAMASLNWEVVPPPQGDANPITSTVKFRIMLDDVEQTAGQVAMVDSDGVIRGLGGPAQDAGWLGGKWWFSPLNFKANSAGGEYTIKFSPDDSSVYVASTTYTFVKFDSAKTEIDITSSDLEGGSAPAGGESLDWEVVPPPQGDANPITSTVKFRIMLDDVEQTAGQVAMVDSDGVIRGLGGPAQDAGWLGGKWWFSPLNFKANSAGGEYTIKFSPDDSGVYVASTTYTFVKFDSAKTEIDITSSDLEGGSAPADVNCQETETIGDCSDGVQSVTYTDQVQPTGNGQACSTDTTQPCTGADGASCSQSDHCDNSCFQSVCRTPVNCVETETVGNCINGEQTTTYDVSASAAYGGTPCSTDTTQTCTGGGESLDWEVVPPPQGDANPITSTVKFRIMIDDVEQTAGQVAMVDSDGVIRGLGGPAQDAGWLGGKWWFSPLNFKANSAGGEYTIKFSPDDSSVYVASTTYTFVKFDSAKTEIDITSSDLEGGSAPADVNCQETETIGDCSDGLQSVTYTDKVQPTGNGQACSTDTTQSCTGDFGASCSDDSHCTHGYCDGDSCAVRDCLKDSGSLVTNAPCFCDFKTVFDENNYELLNSGQPTEEQKLTETDCTFYSTKSDNGNGASQRGGLSMANGCVLTTWASQPAYVWNYWSPSNDLYKFCGTPSPCLVWKAEVIQNAIKASGGTCASADYAEGQEPVPCVGSWGTWSACSGGSRSRTYTVTQAADNDGAACDHLDDDTEDELCSCNLGHELVGGACIKCRVGRYSNGFNGCSSWTGRYFAGKTKKTTAVDMRTLIEEKKANLNDGNRRRNVRDMLKWMKNEIIGLSRKVRLKKDTLSFSAAFSQRLISRGNDVDVFVPKPKTKITTAQACDEADVDVSSQTVPYEISQDEGETALVCKGSTPITKLLMERDGEVHDEENDVYQYACWNGAGWDAEVQVADGDSYLCGTQAFYVNSLSGVTCDATDPVSSADSNLDVGTDNCGTIAEGEDCTDYNCNANFVSQSGPSCTVDGYQPAVCECPSGFVEDGAGACAAAGGGESLDWEVVPPPQGDANPITSTVKFRIMLDDVEQTAGQVAMVDSDGVIRGLGGPAQDAGWLGGKWWFSPLNFKANSAGGEYTIKFSPDDSSVYVASTTYTFVKFDSAKTEIDITSSDLEGGSAPADVNCQETETIGDCSDGVQSVTYTDQTQHSGNGQACSTDTTQSCTGADGASCSQSDHCDNSCFQSVCRTPVNCVETETVGNCINGEQTTTYDVSASAAYGGTPCSTGETVPCTGADGASCSQSDDCDNSCFQSVCRTPVNCVETETVGNCINGEQTTTYSFDTLAAYGGTPCSTDTTQTCTGDVGASCTLNDHCTEGNCDDSSNLCAELASTIELISTGVGWDTDTAHLIGTAAGCEAIMSEAKAEVRKLTGYESFEFESGYTTTVFNTALDSSLYPKGCVVRLAGDGQVMNNRMYFNIHATGGTPVASRQAVVTIVAPANAITWDGQTYDLCAGTDATVTYNGDHDIQEISQTGYDAYDAAEHIGAKILDFPNPFVDGDEVTVSGLGAPEGTTRYFICTTHTASKFATTCAAAGTAGADGASCSQSDDCDNSCFQSVCRTPVNCVETETVGNCINGEQTTTYSFDTLAAYGGTPCSTGETVPCTGADGASCSQSDDCDNSCFQSVCRTPVNCVETETVGNCINGEQTTTYSFDTLAAYGGTPCSTGETVPCTGADGALCTLNDHCTEGNCDGGTCGAAAPLPDCVHDEAATQDCSCTASSRRRFLRMIGRRLSATCTTGQTCSADGSCNAPTFGDWATNAPPPSTGEVTAITVRVTIDGDVKSTGEVAAFLDSGVQACYQSTASFIPNIPTFGTFKNSYVWACPLHTVAGAITDGGKVRFHYSPDGTEDMMLDPEYTFITGDTAYYDLIEAEIEHTWKIADGFSWLGLSLSQPDFTLKNIQDTTDEVGFLADHGFENEDSITCQGAATVYFDDFGWFSSNPDTNPLVDSNGQMTFPQHEMCIFKAASANTLTFKGYLDSTVDYTLVEGTNYISIASEERISINDFLESSDFEGDTEGTSDGDSITCQEAASKYWSGFGWFSSNPDTNEYVHQGELFIDPGQGCKLKKKTAGTYTHVVP